MTRFTEVLAIPRYTLYLQDYGGPVGFRMALTHPERVQALILQDGVAHNEGLGANWKTRRAFWADRKANESALRTNLLSLPPRVPAMWVTIPMSSVMIPTCGPMSSPSSASLARPTFKVTCSTTTARMWSHTQNGKPGCARGSRGCW